MEMMMRQLEAPGAPQAHRQVLACLAPWMHNLSFAARWEGDAPLQCSFSLRHHNIAITNVLSGVALYPARLPFLIS